MQSNLLYGSTPQSPSQPDALIAIISCWSSSGDELDEGGLLKQQKEESISSSEDEFEKEMQMELESVMRSYENDHGKNSFEHNNLICCSCCIFSIEHLRVCLELCLMSSFVCV